MFRRRPHRRTRTGAAFFAGLVLCSGAAACTTTSDRPASSESSATASSSSTGPVTLRFAVYGNRVNVAAYRRIAEVYSQEHPNVTVRVESTPNAITAEDRLDRGFAAGSAPDLFLTDQTRLPSLVVAQQVQPVDQLLEQRGVQFGDNYERLGLEAFSSDSALQCMPNNVSPYVVFYNKGLLVPRTVIVPGEDPPTIETGWRWDQFAAAALQMSHGGVKGVYLAPRLTTLVPLIRSAGKDILDDPRVPTTLTLADEGTRTALEQILTVARDPRITFSAGQLARRDAISRFENGQLGMMIGTRALVPRLRDRPALRFDVFPLPSLGRPRTIADITGYCISKTSAHVPEAADFLAFASSKKAASITAETGAVVPANLAALHSDAFLQPGQLPDNADVFITSISRADPLPFTAGWPDAVKQTQPLIDRLFNAPVLDLDTLLPRIDEISAELLARPTPTPSPTPGSPTSSTPDS